MKIIYQKTIKTPLGDMIVCAVNKGICLLEFTDQKNIEKQLRSLSKKLNAEIVEREHLHCKQLEEELKKDFILMFLYSLPELNFRKKSSYFCGKFQGEK